MIVVCTFFCFQGEQLLLTWQRAGHTEDSLRRLLHQEQPETQSALQLLLVKVLLLILLGTFASSARSCSLCHDVPDWHCQYTLYTIIHPTS